MNISRFFFLSAAALAIVGVSSANNSEVLFDEDGDPLDDTSEEARQLMMSHRRRLMYVPPSWWDYLVDNFPDIDGEGPLKRCFRRTEPPANGARCARNPKTCYFGDTRTCPGVGPFPDVRCRCDGEAGSQTWDCQPVTCPVEENVCCDGQVHGDPHFVSFQGENFDYHGECDLVLIKSSNLGLELQIRTVVTDRSGFVFSQIASIALRIGTDILEYEDTTLTTGGGQNLYLNGVQQLPGAPPATVGGFELIGSLDRSFLQVSFGTSQLYLSLSGGRGSVYIYGCNDFADSRGFLGTWCDQPADFLGRDETSSFTEQFEEIGWPSGFGYTLASHAYGQEWEVGSSDPQLFRTASSSQCGGRRRLQSSVPSGEEVEDAAAVCADIFNKDKLNQCVFDVVSSGDESWATDPAYNQIFLNGTIVTGPATAIIRTIAGQVLEDTDNNDVGDMPISGVNIAVLDTSGVIAGTTLTDSQGEFSLDLPAGVYSVVETNNPNYVDVSDSDGGNDNAIVVDTTQAGAGAGLIFVDELP